MGWATRASTVLSRYRIELLLGAAVALLLAGAVAWFAERHDLAAWFWTVGTLLGLVLSVAWTVRALRDRRPSVDVIAVLALGGAWAVDEPFAGAVITVMLLTGQALEARAAARARRELSLLVSRAPRMARRRVGSSVALVPVEQIVVADVVLVGSGEVVPVDGRLRETAALDESALTGEPLPVVRASGDEVRSGVVNAGLPFELTATAAAAESTYAAVVRLVEQAQATSAPFVRLADRLAVLFVPLALVLAGGAWLLSGDPVRAVAVLVVATPCPLLLAAPIAIISGLSRAARAGVVVKGGAALERLAGAQVMLFDKTGTLTYGRPTVLDVVPAPDVPVDQVVRLAAGLDQVSPHLLASAIVSAAARRGLPLHLPEQASETAGYGLAGRVDGHLVRVGKLDWVVGAPHPAWVRHVRRRASLDGSLTVFVSIDGQPAGAFLLEDRIRPDAPRMIRALRHAGIGRVVLVTGDRADTAAMVGRIVGVDAVLADCDPADKLAAVAAETAHGTTVMVGDGVNDAPALAAADVGVALAAQGVSASSETADVVLTVDRVDALADAALVARRARRIARQAAGVGMAMSLVAMLVAAAGLLPPAAGAALQEVIDVVAIAIALRAVAPGRVHTVAMHERDVAAAQRLRVEHDAVLDVVEQIRVVADGISADEADLSAVQHLVERLETQLVPHERADEQLLMPIMARALGPEATAALSRTHAEIEHQTHRLRRLLTDLEDEDVRPEDVTELRRMLYGLYGILRLHNAQEEESAFSLVPAGQRHGEAGREG